MKGSRERPSRIALTGASGLLGTWLRHTAPDDVEIVAVVHRSSLDGAAGPSVRADLRDRMRTRRALLATRPDVVIHAAYAREREAIVEATRHVAEVTRDRGAGLINVSTEAVFAGDGRPRRETETPDPTWDYGGWKAEAEQLARHHVSGTATLRLPLLVSLDPPDAGTARLLEAAGTGMTVDWYRDELRQPAWAHDVAEAIWRIVRMPDRERAGPWHLPGPELLDRYELARRTAVLLGLGTDPCRSATRPPERDAPRDLRLNGARAERTIGWDPSPIESGTGPIAGDSHTSIATSP